MHISSIQGSYPTSTLSSTECIITMHRHRHSKTLHLTAWAGPEHGYRPPSPYPGFEEPKLQSRYYEMPPADSGARHRYVDDARKGHGEVLQRQIDEQNAKIARRLPRAQDRYSRPDRSAPKRIRFLLPTLRSDKDELDDLTRELAKLSLRDPNGAPGMRRCSRCGQKV